MNEIVALLVRKFVGLSLFTVTLTADEKDMVRLLIKHSYLKINPVGNIELHQNYDNVTFGLTLNEVDIGQTKGKLDAVKEYKNRTGKSLMDSKKAVEDHFSKNGIRFYSGL